MSARPTVSKIILCIAVTLSFATASILHTLIPHAHGESDHGHGGTTQEESAVWTSLHSAARHDQQDIFDATEHDPLQFFFFLSAILLAGLILDTGILPSLQSNPLQGRYLQRGIAQYRRFG